MSKQTDARKLANDLMSVEDGGGLPLKAAKELLRLEAENEVLRINAKQHGGPVEYIRIRRGMQILNWNRSQDMPPIEVTKELWVAQELEQFYISQPSEQQSTIPGRMTNLANNAITTAYAAGAKAEREAITAMCDEMKTYWADYASTALLNGDVDLSNAASGEPRAAEAIARMIRERK